MSVDRVCLFKKLFFKVTSKTVLLMFKTIIIDVREFQIDGGAGTEKAVKPILSLIRGILIYLLLDIK